MLRCTFLGNCGFFLENETDAILVDCPNGFHYAYDRLAEEEYARILNRCGRYDKLRGLFFTHLHDDHYDAERTAELIENDRELVLFAPDANTEKSGAIQAGSFTVRYFKIPHSGENLRDVPHWVLMVETEGKQVFVTGDSEWTEPHLIELVAMYRPDCGIFNPNFVSHEEGRQLMAKIPENYIYHYPVNREDAYGIARKCRSRFVKHADELRNVHLVDELPYVAEI